VLTGSTPVVPAAPPGQLAYVTDGVLPLAISTGLVWVYSNGTSV